jgi:hypothetical protein
MISYIQYDLAPNVLKTSDSAIRLLENTTKDDLIKQLLSLPVGAYFIELEDGDYLAN